MADTIEEGSGMGKDKILNHCLQILNSLTKVVLCIWDKNNIQSMRREVGMSLPLKQVT